MYFWLYVQVGESNVASSGVSYFEWFIAQEKTNVKNILYILFIWYPEKCI